MPKTHNIHRESKKKPLMTAKEKRLAKHAKKHGNEVQPLVNPATH